MMGDGEQANAGGDVHVAALALPAPGFEAFTYPRYAPLLSDAEPPENSRERIVVGAWSGGRPAGLALLSRPFRETERRLLSVMVRRDLRRRGIGLRLLALGEESAAAQGTKKMWALHSSQLRGVGAYEALMRRAGWASPEEFEFRLAGRAGWALRAREDWAPFLTRLRKRGFSATSWNELTPGDRARIAALVQTLPEEDRRFNPLEGETRVPVIPELSLALRRAGEIVGWILGSTGALADTVYYSYGYVLASVRRPGWLVGGVREVSERQADMMGPQTLAVFETSSGNAGMRRFMERQLKPYSLWTDSRYSSVKELGGPVPSSGTE